MKKDLLFVVHGLGIGGIETCLVNLVNALPIDKFNIDILLEHPIYDMKERIKVPVNYIEVSRYMMDPSESLDAIKQHGGILKNIFWFLRYAVFRVLVKLKAEKKWKVFQKLPKHYDVAIAYSHGGYCPYYVIDKVSADKRVLWYHSGVYSYPPKKKELDLCYYGQYDNVVCVSDDCRKEVARQLPTLISKLIVLANIYDVDYVRRKAAEFYPKTYNDELNIVTVGRLSEEKQPDLALQVCKRLIDLGYRIKWHWVGDGVYGNEIGVRIKELKMEEFFIPEGNITNPYPYIQNADIYVQTSKYEAYCTTIMEAIILCRPIVTTNVGGVKSQIEERKTGFIVNDNVDSLVNAIEELLNHPELRNSFEKELRKMSIIDNRLEKYMKTVFRESK